MSAFGLLFALAVVGAFVCGLAVLGERADRAAERRKHHPVPRRWRDVHLDLPHGHGRRKPYDWKEEQR